MGDSKGHVTNGLAFCAMGLWHLFNLLKLTNLNSHSPIPMWFRPLELLLIMAASFLSLSMELFTSSFRHSPFATDGSILSSHISHIEHSLIALAFFVYALSAFVLRSTAAPAGASLTASLAAAAFALQLLVFHLHSTDHAGLDGHYHHLFQLLIFASLATTILAVGFPLSFLIGFFRSITLLLQGVWLIVMGFALWTPVLIPKGCFLHWEDDGHLAVRCGTDEALNRAKVIATLLFCCCVLGIVALAVTTYLVATMVKDKVDSGKCGDLSVARSDGDDEIEVEGRSD